MSTQHKELVWLVTGTSSGFGRDLVLAALARGEKVIATARSRSLSKLEDLREKGAAVVELDVGWPLDKLQKAVDEAESMYGRIDVLFNNAGYALVMALEEATPEETLDLFNVDVFGGLNLARAVLPGMRARKEGTILWNGSLYGWKPESACGLYSAAKFCMRGMSQVLHGEIAPLGLRSLIIEPGFFRTSILDNLNLYEPRIADYNPLTDKVYKMYQSLNGNQPGDPQRGVGVILDLVRGEGVVEGREVPTTIPLGPDCFEAVESVCKETLKIIGDWKDVITGTDIPE